MVNQFEPIFEVGLTVWAKGIQASNKTYPFVRSNDCRSEWLQRWTPRTNLAKAATWMRRHRWHLKWYFHIRMWYIILLCMLYTPIFSIHRDTSLKHFLHIFFEHKNLGHTNLRSSRGGGVPWSQRSSGSCSFCIARGLWREECTTGDLFLFVFGGFGCLQMCGDCFLLVGLLSGTR